jgi:hypothetical protein
MQKGSWKAKRELEIISKEAARPRDGEHQGVKSEVIKVKRQGCNRRL